MSALASTPSTAGERQRHQQRLERAPPVGHGERLARHTEHAAAVWSAATTNSSPVGEQRPAPARAQPLERRRGCRRGCRSLGPACRRGAAPRHPSTASRSSWNGMSSAHIRRAATIAPAAFPARRSARVPARQQPVTERATEGIAGTRGRTRPRRGTARPARARRRRWRRARRRHPSSRSPPKPTRQQLLGGAIGIGLADRDLALGAVADRHRHVVEHLVELGRGVGRRPPELRAPVEVEHGVGAPRRARRAGRGSSSGWARPTGTRSGTTGSAPTRRHRGRRRRSSIVHVGRLRRRDRRSITGSPGSSIVANASGVGSDGSMPTKRVSTPNVSSRRPPHVLPHRVVAEPCEHGRVMAEPGGGNGDVGRRAADGLAERPHLVERHAELLGVEIDADPPDRQQLQRDRHRSHGARFERAQEREAARDAPHGALARRRLAVGEGDVGLHHVPAVVARRLRAPRRPRRSARCRHPIDGNRPAWVAAIRSSSPPARGRRRHRRHPSDARCRSGRVARGRAPRRRHRRS